MNVSTDCVLVNEMLQDERDEFYERLVLLRKRTGMSVREFAEFAGIPENTYRTYEAKNPRYRNHLKSYVIDLLEYKLTMEGKLPGTNGNNVIDWMERIYNMLAVSYEFRPVRKVSFIDGRTQEKES